MFVVTLYGALLAALYWKQEVLLFQPTVLPADHRFSLPDVQEVQVPVDGATLSALHFKQANARGLVFFLHGNAGDLSTWVTDTAFYRRTGFDLFMLDYRGYGKSTGRIESEAQLHADVRNAFDHIAPQYAGKKIVIYGRSLGSGLAAKLAADVPADLLVMVSPYSSMHALAQEHYPWVPVSLLRYPLRSDQWLPQVKAPTMLMHGERDGLIDIKHAEQLAALRPGTELVRLPQIDHGDVHQSQLYIETLAQRLASL